MTTNWTITIILGVFSENDIALVRFMDTTIDGHQKTAVPDETIVIRKLLSGTKAQENCPVLVGKNEMLRRYNCPSI